MNKIYRILGKRGRTTIPHAIRVKLGLRHNDLISFEEDGDTVIVRREKVCNNCSQMTLTFQMMTTTLCSTSSTIFRIRNA